jgi:hypothetical protein
MNIYKKSFYTDENDEEQVIWNRYYKVEFPDGEVMDENNHDFEKDGFFWSEKPPAEYLDWEEEQEKEKI